MAAGFILSRSHATVSRQAASPGARAGRAAREPLPRGVFDPRGTGHRRIRCDGPAAAADRPGDPGRPLRCDISFIPTRVPPLPWRGSSRSGARVKRTKFGRKIELSEAIRSFCCISGRCPAEAPPGPVGQARSVPTRARRAPSRGHGRGAHAVRGALPSARGAALGAINPPLPLTIRDGTKIAPCPVTRGGRDTPWVAALVAVLGTVQTELRGLCSPRGQRDPDPGPRTLPFCASPAACHAVRPWVTALPTVSGTVQTALRGLCTPVGSGTRARPRPDPCPSRVGAPRRAASMARRSLCPPGRARRWIGAACPPPRKALGSNRGRGGSARYGGHGGNRGTRGHTGTRDTAAPAPEGTAGRSAAAAGPGVRSGLRCGRCGARPRRSPRGGLRMEDALGIAGVRRARPLGRSRWRRWCWRGAAPGGARCSRAWPGPLGSCRGRTGAVLVQMPCPDRAALQEGVAPWSPAVPGGARTGLRVLTVNLPLLRCRRSPVDQEVLPR